MMKAARRPRPLHSWAVTPTEAVALQRALSRRVALSPLTGPVRRVAGADLAVDAQGGVGMAGVIVYQVDADDAGGWSLREIERTWAAGPLRFPYIPGLLSFREAPLLLQAFDKLQTIPDLIIFDGQGIAHPRGLGIASHMGVWLDRPTIGCAKSCLVGSFAPLAAAAGSQSPLRYQGKLVGAVLRSRANVRPLFVSPGHRITRREATVIVLACCDGYRLPKPIREADHYVAELKRRRELPITPTQETSVPARRSPASRRPA